MVWRVSVVDRRIAAEDSAIGVFERTIRASALHRRRLRVLSSPEHARQPTRVADEEQDGKRVHADG